MKQFLIFTLMFHGCFSYSPHDKTVSAFGTVVQGKLAAFGDFNADKHTDIFTLSDDGKENLHRISNILKLSAYLLEFSVVRHSRVL